MSLRAVTRRHCQIWYEGAFAVAEGFVSLEVSEDEEFVGRLPGRGTGGNRGFGALSALCCVASVAAAKHRGRSTAIGIGQGRIRRLRSTFSVLQETVIGDGDSNECGAHCVPLRASRFGRHRGEAGVCDST